MAALFSGERVSHTDTFILAGVVLGLFVGIRTLRKRMHSKELDQGLSVNAGGLLCWHSICSKIRPV